MPKFDPQGMLDPLEALGTALLEQSHAPAVVIQVERGDLSARYAAGAAAAGTTEAVSTDNTFEIGSQTKMMTAALTLELAGTGRIDLDAPIADYLPASLLKGIDNAGEATVRQLLAMTSGIPSYTDARGESGLPLFVEKLMAGEAFGPHDALDVARGMKPTGEPGDHYHYSNTNYLLLGLMLERQTGRSLTDLYESHIFRPLHMDDTTARPFSSDDPRLDSYAVSGADDALVDVTDIPWHFKGEGGVVSTTDDMIDFLRALVKPGGLLSADARREMMDFKVVTEGDGFDMSFGLGLARIRFDSGETFIGFTGGTLGTSSSTYVEVKTGAVVSIAGTASDFASDDGAFALVRMLKEATDWHPQRGDGPLSVDGASASDTAVIGEGRGVGIDIDGARTQLAERAGALAVGDVVFSDGSLLIAGDGRRGGHDQRADDIDIARDHAGADGKANHLLGLGGDDRLTGGGGGEWLQGNAGDDTLSGGGGDDRIEGGLGSDRMTGGAGADVFVLLRVAEAARGDVVLDFETGSDRIDLTAIDGVPGGRDDALRWLGAADFDGQAGAVVFETDAGGATLGVDVDGDRLADMTIRLDGVTSLGRDDVLL
jgi:D-alanyl-D-alanine carboxypeptidase